MNTYIYIKNDGIQIVQAKGKKVSYQQLDIPQGAILNGVIMNAHVLKDALNTIVPKPKKVELIIDSSNIMTKKVITPIMKEDKMNEIVKGEFDLFEKEEMYRFDSTIIKKDLVLSAMGYAVNRELIDAYTNLFKECLMKVSRIDIVTNGIINYIANQRDFEHKTFVFNIITGEIMLSLLFDNGEYKLTNRIRLLQKNQGELFYQELYTRLSSMVQFNQSDRSQHIIEQSFYIGLTQEEISGYKEYTSRLTEIDIQGYVDSSIDLSYFYPSLLRYAKKNDINLVVNKEGVALKRRKVLTRVLQAIICLTVIGLLSFYTYTRYETLKAVEQEIEELSSYITSTELTDGVAEFIRLQEENNVVNAVKTTYEEVLAKNKYSNPVTKLVLKQIFGSEQINSFSYFYTDEGNSLSITGESDTSQDAVEYATSLREQEFFADMHYRGYTMFEQELDVELEEDETETYFKFNIDASFDIQQEEVAEDDN